MLEAKLWKIGDSSPALQFKVIELPNNFIKTSKPSSNNDLNKSQIGRLNFWTLFNDVVQERGELNRRKPSTDHWYNFSIGTSRCHIAVDLLSRESKVRVGIWIPDDKEMFDELSRNKEEIEKELNMKLDWERLNDKKGSRICKYINNFKFESTEERHLALSNEIIDQVIALKKVFTKFI